MGRILRRRRFDAAMEVYAHGRASLESGHKKARCGCAVVFVILDSSIGHAVS